MYEARILKKLIDDDIVEVNALLIKHRKALKISANDILVLSTLSRQEVKKNYIYSSKLQKLTHLSILLSFILKLFLNLKTTHCTLH